MQFQIICTDFLQAEILGAALLACEEALEEAQVLI